MGDEPTAGEVARQLAQTRDDFREDVRDLRSDMRAGHQELTDRLNHAVSTGAYQADRRADDARFKAIEQQVSGIAKAGADRAANRQWVIAAVIIPIGIGLLEIYFAIKGVR